MGHTLDALPCGCLTLSKDGILLSMNKPLLDMVGYHLEQLVGQSINTILPASSRAFFQLYFIPMVNVKHHVEEMYFSLLKKDGAELPILINASLSKTNNIICVLIPMKKRIEYETQLLLAKKETEKAIEEKNKVLENLEQKQEELIKVNKQNKQYKIDTTRELQLAKKVQEKSLTETISTREIQIEAHFKASSELSGDIYGFYKINKHQYGIILLDVMGHGLSSALITMSLQALFHRLISVGTKAEVVIKELDHHLHHLFHNNEEAWHYCTAIYLFVDTSKKTIDYINAGHPPAIYQGPDGVQKELISNLPPIGSFEGYSYEKSTLSYTSGGRVLLYTDGVSDPLKLDRLNSLLAEHASVPITNLKQTIIQTLETESDGYYKNDDQCFILIDLK